MPEIENDTNREDMRDEPAKQVIWDVKDLDPDGVEFSRDKNDDEHENKDDEKERDDDKAEVPEELEVDEEVVDVEMESDLNAYLYEENDDDGCSGDY